MSAGDHRLYHLLQLAAHRLRTHADREGMLAGGVTAAQAGALFVIAAQPGITQRGVARALGQQESALTAMVARLAQAGFIDAGVDPSDRRARTLTLTARGQAALDAMRAALDRLNARLDAAVGQSDLEAAVRALRAIVDMPLDRATSDQP